MILSAESEETSSSMVIAQTSVSGWEVDDESASDNKLAQAVNMGLQFWSRSVVYRNLEMC